MCIKEVITGGERRVNFKVISTQLCVCGSLPHTSRLRSIQGIIKTLKCLFVSGLIGSFLPPASIIPCLVSLLPLSPPLFPNNLFSAQESKLPFENQLKSHPLFSLSIDVPSHPKQRSKSIQCPTRPPMVWFSRYHSSLTAHSLLFLIPFMVPTQSFGTCCSLCIEHSLPNIHVAASPISLRSHPLVEAFPDLSTRNHDTPLHPGC